MEYNNPNDPWMYDPYKGMSDDERMKAGCLQMALYLVMIFIGLLLCALLGSCTTTKYVPVIEHHTDTLYQNKVVHDSIYQHDSVQVMIKGDTTTIDRWHTRYVYKEVHDTTYVSRIDSVPQPYPVEVIKEVPVELSMWELLKMKAGGIAILLCIFAFLFWIWRAK